MRADLAESKVSYELRLDNKSKILLDVYVVYSSPASSKKTGDGKEEFSWKLVSRKYCKRGCKGPILRAIQRFGKLGRRCSEIWSSHYNVVGACLIDVFLFLLAQVLFLEYLAYSVVPHLPSPTSCFRNSLSNFCGSFTF